MSVNERKRLEVFSRVREGAISVAKAAALLGISERQAWRVWARYRTHADAGLIHGLRGKASNRTIKAAVRASVLRRYRATYIDFGPTLACEYLAREEDRTNGDEQQQQQVSHDTLGRWLRAEGLLGEQRRRGRHRTRRPRRACAGELVQMDGSWHDWFEGRGDAAWCCLMVLVDDATGQTYCRFYPRETQEAAFDVFGRYVQAPGCGLPQALYVDRAGIYRGEDANGRPTVTQFGRAMADLGVELILANSPQAKGRVERKNGTLQDRLVKAMRLAGIRSIAEANAWLTTSSFLADLNAKFAVKPQRRANLHRAVPRGLVLAEVLCVQEPRAVARDWCVQWKGQLLQIDPKHARLDLPRPGRRVTVIAQLDGTLHVRYQDQPLTWRHVSQRPDKPKPPKRPVVNNKRYVPPAVHPWKARPSCVASRRTGLVAYGSEARAGGRKD